MTFKDMKYFMDFYINHADEVILCIDDYGIFTNTEYLDSIIDIYNCLPSYTIINDYDYNIELVNGLLILEENYNSFMFIHKPYIFYNDNIDKCLVMNYRDELDDMVLITINKDKAKDKLANKIKLEEKELSDIIEKLRNLSPNSFNSVNPYIYINIDNICDSILDNLDIEMIYSSEITFNDNIIEIIDINDEVSVALYSESNKDLSDYFYKLKLLVTI